MNLQCKLEPVTSIKLSNDVQSENSLEKVSTILFDNQPIRLRGYDELPKNSFEIFALKVS